MFRIFIPLRISLYGWLVIAAALEPTNPWVFGGHVRYEGKLYRPPSEANAYILQATIGCSWNKCVYCDMYRDKNYRVRELDAVLEDIRMAEAVAADDVTKVFVADGDALGMPMTHWNPILGAIRDAFPNLRRVSCYAMAENVLEKSQGELNQLRKAGLSRLYIGPESGDDATLKRIAKGATFQEHVEAAQKARLAEIEMSVIVLLGVGGIRRTKEHAAATGALISAMNPEFFAALTTTIIPGTPLARMHEKETFELPSVTRMLEELKEIVASTHPTDALFRTNHASNYLPLGGRVPRDSARIIDTIERALSDTSRLRPEWMRGL